LDERESEHDATGTIGQLESDRLIGEFARKQTLGMCLTTTNFLKIIGFITQLVPIQMETPDRVCVPNVPLAHNGSISELDIVR